MHPRNLRLKAEHGFTTVVVMGMLMVGMLLVAAAFSASDGDTSSARHDQYYKEAYNAAEAGINWYLFHLTQDANYWSKCASTTPSNSPPVYQKNPSSFQWTSIPNSQAQYMIELLPAAGQSSCVLNTSASMIDPSSGAFKIRSTGLYRGVKRTIVGTFRRVGFLNFLYFTDFETMDPVTYGSNSAWAQTNCAVYYYVTARPSGCNDPAFISSDTINGPLHTNDEMLTCGSPTFGQKSTDRIESSSTQPTSHPGYRQDTSCSGNPNFVGIFKAPAPTLTLPPSNQQLQDEADSAYVFTGTTHIVLGTPTAGQMTVNGTAMSMPPKGIIYVQNATCSPSYSSTMTYPAITDGTGCGDIYVRGAVPSDLTIAADNDIIIDGNLTHSAGVELGLIANNFVRVYHPCSGGTNQSTSPEDSTQGSMTSPTIDAAILAINHSFIVDNWACGSPLGTLTVYGAIAQKFRGPVGTHSGSTVASGYSKGYSYDYELRYHQPPYFLDPVQAGWGILQETEQVPPAH
jgi:hypothetical protein